MYWGTSSGVYDQVRDVSQTTASVSDLTILEFGIISPSRLYNEAGLESGYSEEVSAIVASPDSTPAPQYLLNISTRVRVRGGDDVMIGGFIIDGDSNKDVVFRALGPSLANLGVPGVLADPTLELYDADGLLVNKTIILYHPPLRHSSRRPQAAKPGRSGHCGQSGARKLHRCAPRCRWH